MSEHPYFIVEKEIVFYSEIDDYLNNIKNLLVENSYVTYPRIVFDGALGNIYYAGQKVEQQVLNKVEREEDLLTAIKRAKGRVTRFENFYGTLDEQEREVIYYSYIYDSQTPVSLHRYLGYKSKRDLDKVKRQALRKLSEHYKSDREERATKLSEEFVKQRSEKIEARLSDTRAPSKPSNKIRIDYKVSRERG